MRDWNVLITISEGGFRQAVDFLEEFGPVSRTDFFNVLVAKCDDTHHLMEMLKGRLSHDTNSLWFLTRVVPVTFTFRFQTPEEFKDKARETVLLWVSDLSGKGFHVRMHRRGFKGRLSSIEIERFLDDMLIEALKGAGTPGHVTFNKPDAIVAVETVGTQAGLSLWKREELERYPFLRLD